MEAKFFAEASAWRAWLAQHHGLEKELLVGFYKRGSGRPTMTWPESVDAALCFGWIDGVRRRIDDESYSIRFTPRRARSTWSLVNVRRISELITFGLVEEAGLRAFAARSPELTGIYSFERVAAELSPSQAQQLRGNGTAWEYFRKQPPWYRKAAISWIIGAKRPETQRRRLQQLISDSELKRLIAPLTREKKSKQP